jgi:hypothetical protein
MGPRFFNRGKCILVTPNVAMGSKRYCEHLELECRGSAARVSGDVCKSFHLRFLRACERRPGFRSHLAARDEQGAN